MKGLAVLLSTVVLSTVVLLGQATGPKPLEIYSIDTEGGKSTLYVSPERADRARGQRQSRWPGHRSDHGGSADAGATQIDYLVSTHYHVDHVGGLQELAKRIPIAHFIDHGTTVEGPVTALREQVPGFQAAYAELHAEGEAHGREAGRSPAGHRPRLADRHVSRRRPEDPAAWRRQAEPGVRRLQIHRWTSPPGAIRKTTSP